MHYLFGFSGRINRAKMWLFLLVCIAWEIVTVTVAAVGLKWDGFFASMSAHGLTANGAFNWAALAWPPLDTTQSKVALAIIVLLVVLIVWASFAVMVKRLHDRNKSAWWLLLFSGVPLAYTVASNILVVTYSENTAIVMSGFGTGLAVLAIDIWMFIELYCLRGTRGDNRFGPDPLA